MTNEYKAEQIATAKANYEKFRAEFFAANTRKARLAADESLNFWGSRLAFLENVRETA